MLVAQKVTTGVYKGVTTSELDELAAETAASMTASHPDYALVGWQGNRGRGECMEYIRSAATQCAALAPTAAPAVVANLRTTWRTALQLAARIAVSNLHKNTLKSFSET